MIKLELDFYSLYISAYSLSTEKIEIIILKCNSSITTSVGTSKWSIIICTTLVTIRSFMYCSITTYLLLSIKLFKWCSTTIIIIICERYKFWLTLFINTTSCLLIFY